MEAATGRSLASQGAHDARVEEQEVERAMALTRRRATGEPLQYVTGIAGFRRLELAVGPGVFIPRPETELVAERAIELLPAGGTVVDIGTGSGAIALAVADERPDARTIATEVSPDALRWARRNSSSLGLDVELLEGDLFEPLEPSLRGRVDVVVSNPPYVPEGDLIDLPRDVVEHEPHVALFASKDGLSVAERIAAEARAWLTARGWLVVEIGEVQGRAAAQVLEELGFSRVAIRRDLTGRERIVEATR